MSLDDFVMSLCAPARRIRLEPHPDYVWSMLEGIWVEKDDVYRARVEAFMRGIEQ